jgi:hypothetical protein
MGQKDRLMSLDIVNAVYPLVAEALEGDVPPERIYVNKRRSAELPHVWLYAGSESPASAHFEADHLLYVHVWAASYGESSDLKRKLSFLSGFWVGTHGETHDIHIRRPAWTYTREEDASHWQAIFPVTATDNEAAGIT